MSGHVKLVVLLFLEPCGSCSAWACSSKYSNGMGVQLEILEWNLWLADHIPLFEINEIYNPLRMSLAQRQPSLQIDSPCHRLYLATVSGEDCSVGKMKTEPLYSMCMEMGNGKHR
jgi:hypothetical protein